MAQKKQRKRTKKINLNNNFYFTELDYISKTSSLPVHLASLAYLNYHFKPLRVFGVLIKRGYGVWTVDWDKWEQWKALEQLKKTTQVGRQIRGHGFHFTVKLKHIQNWHKREEYLTNKNIPFVSHGQLKKNQRIIVNGHKVWLTSKSIVIYSPSNKSYFGSTAEEARSLACYNIKQLLVSLNNLLGIDLSDKGKFKIRISKQHYGKVKDELAKQCNDKKEKINCYFEGALWLVIDHSLNEDEIETLHPQTAMTDMDNAVVPFLNSIKSNPGLTLDKIQGEISSVLKLVEGVTKNQVSFDANMASHIEAVKALGLGVNELRSEIKKLSGEYEEQEISKERPSYIG